jgi:hypothetical protein
MPTSRLLDRSVAILSIYTFTHILSLKDYLFICTYIICHRASSLLLLEETLPDSSVDSESSADSLQYKAKARDSTDALQSSVLAGSSRVDIDIRDSRASGRAGSAHVIGKGEREPSFEGATLRPFSATNTFDLEEITKESLR